LAKRHKNSTAMRFPLFLLIAAVTGSNQPALGMRAASQDTVRFRPVAASQADTEAAKDPVEALAAARVIYICSRTGFVKSEVIENELFKRADFQQSRLQITKNLKAADLVMEVRRSNFTTEYPYVVVDQKTQLVVASGKVNSLFGTAASKIAKGFMRQIQTVRTPAGVKSKK
jgi:hypothetical protein